MSDVWYFAYGSNLSKGRKQIRTGLIRRAIRAQLHGYRLAFNKEASDGGVFANIVPSADGVVFGVIYLCNPDAMAELDRREGVMAGHYQRTSVRVCLEDGTSCEAQTYVAGDHYTVPESHPESWYLDLILTGALEHGIPAEYIRQIAELGGRD